MRIFDFSVQGEAHLIGIYRRELDSNDHFHKAIAFLLGLIVVGLGIAYDITGKIELILGTPLLTLAMLGTIIRLDTIVHRIGWLLKKGYDPWECERSRLRYDKKFVAIGDIFMTSPVLYYLVKAYSALFANSERYMVFSYIGCIGLTMLAVTLWGMSAKMVRIEKEN